MMRGLVSHDHGLGLDNCSDERTTNLPPDWGIPGHNDDELCVPEPGCEGGLVHYFSHLKFDYRESPIDKLRRCYKAIVESKRCPGCNWVPKWKSALGPFPLTAEDTVWCSRMCKDRSERAKHDSQNTAV